MAQRLARAVYFSSRSRGIYVELNLFGQTRSYGAVDIIPLLARPEPERCFMFFARTLKSQPLARVVCAGRPETLRQLARTENAKREPLHAWVELSESGREARGAARDADGYKNAPHGMKYFSADEFF
ncbi:hypothetical protein EVAR_52071_1 [Eumeta japonica]|uniref:Uncharacterized protein n=1 Tax=Eumeta variegata TaxID=151549 RepID=A0A4C1Y3M7_EUMVA|nr:hypothetical protein EVAR_52071_1 [Eumeta japonica]